MESGNVAQQPSRGQANSIMKIFFLSRGLNYGGAERQLVILANELARRRHEIVLATYYSGGALAKELNPSVRLLELGKRSRWDLFTFYFRLLGIVRREKPDVLHAWGMITPNLVTTMIRAFNPKVRLFWCVPSSNLEMFFDRVEWTASWIEARLSRFADCIVSNSEAGVQDAIKRGFPRDKTICIPNGIDPKLFFPDAAAGRAVRAEWGIPEATKLIGVVARLDPIKNHTLFVKAAARVAQSRPDVRFVCVGGGATPYQQELQNLAHSLGLEGKLLWVPARSDMRAVYNALDIFCSPSSSEGLPNVIGEAMACGLHGVVTDVGDCRLVAGETATIVPSNDVEVLANALRKKLEVSERFNMAARQRILDNFTVMHLGDRTEQALLLHCAMGSALEREKSKQSRPAPLHASGDNS